MTTSNRVSRLHADIGVRRLGRAEADGQATIPDCGYTSVLAALVHNSPQWITNIARPDGADLMGDTATFGIHDMVAPYAEKSQTVDKGSQPGNRGDKTDVW